MILTSLQKLHINVSNLGKIIAATSFECLPKKQKIAQSGHTDSVPKKINFSKKIHACLLWMLITYMSRVSLVSDKNLCLMNSFFSEQRYLANV